MNLSLAIAGQQILPAYLGSRVQFIVLSDERRKLQQRLT